MRTAKAHIEIDLDISESEVYDVPEERDADAPFYKT